MNSKERVYAKTVEVLSDGKYPNGITATELEGFMDIKRSTISHYLNMLFKEGKLLKTDSRPVRFYLPLKNMPTDNDKNKKSDVFKKLIGFNGSLKTQVDQCRSAVIYPPRGLPMLISGNSGVGKSYLAYLIYEYALSVGVINEKAPFIELNCADYANNPELLSSVLFGHVKGAFTGAEKEKKGLMDEADGGYLFLDEVHRLSFENQEKLFIYLDKGKFRRLGENESWHEVDVRFIFATTEDTERALLETFSRRIPLKISLLDFQKRPVIERVELVYNFYKLEAEKLSKNIEVSENVIDLLVSSSIKGNIGALRNFVKLSCARAYEKQTYNDCLLITIEDLPEEIIQNNYSNLTLKKAVKNLLIDNDKMNLFLLPDKIFDMPNADIENFIKSCINESGNVSTEKIKLIINKIDNAISDIYGINIKNVTDDRLIDPIAKIMYYCLNNEIEQISRKYGITFDEHTVKSIFNLFVYAVYGHFKGIKKDDGFQILLSKIKKMDYKAFLLSKKLVTKFENYNNENYDELLLFIPVIISDLLKPSTKIHAIIAAHGDSTASSIASVANSLCKSYIFEPFDMPITDDAMALVEKINKYIKELDTSGGLVLLVDMGSLFQMYEQIKSSIDGELLIINNVTTNIALDIGFKILRGYTIHEIIKETESTIKTEIRYYEGITQGDNIIISCISGMGIAQKLKDIFEKSIKNKNLEIVTMEYSKLKDILQSEQSSLLKKTRLVITTNNINTKPIPCVNIETLLTQKGYETMLNDLSGVFNAQELDHLFDELIKFFSIEGIAGSLSFLNPNIIVSEVEHVIKQYETYYGATFENYLRINLYMHISIMIERLMTTEDNLDEEASCDLTNKQKEFAEVTRNAFDLISKKYKIKVPISEILLMYEVMADYI